MSQGAVASGNITPSRIVYLDDTTGYAGRVLQAASATAKPLYGVAQAGTHNIPLTIGGASLDDGYAATAGLNLAVYTEGDCCKVEAGAAFSSGNTLTSDSSGRAIATTTDANFVVGVALAPATAAGQLVEMRVQTMMRA